MSARSTVDIVAAGVSRHTLAASAACALACLLAPPTAEAQDLVFPRRATKSHVKYDSFDWRHVDIWRGSESSGTLQWQTGQRAHSLGMQELSEELPPGGFFATAPPPAANPLQKKREQDDAGPSEPPPTSGGVRLFFYDRERPIAERAAASIAEAYEDLSEVFHYTPTRTFPYFLYNSYQEFLQTNVFPVREGVLGVTGIKGLEMALPYFGDHQLFELVSRHELAHQFTLQKVRSVAAKKQTVEDPIHAFPLWFVEGLAEYYAHEGLDPQTKMLVRDMFLHPTSKHRYAVGHFFEERLNYLWAYKLGQARCAFLEEVYGEGTLQRILDESWRLATRSEKNARVLTFRGLVTKVVNEPPQRIHARFTSWSKRRAYPLFLHSSTKLENLRVLNTEERMVKLSTSMDGTLLLYRHFDGSTGRFSLRMIDYRSPSEVMSIASEGSPGIESLHPASERNFSVARGSLAFVARAEARDRIYWQHFQHEAKFKRTKNSPESVKRGRSEKNEQVVFRGSWHTSLRLGARETYRLADRGIVAVSTVAVSPDEERLAFVGVDRTGQSDVYVLEPKTDAPYTLTRVTSDWYAERGLTWAGACLLYSADATSHKHFNLYRRCGAEFDAVERLTTEARSHRDPIVLADGRIFVTAYDDFGANLYEVTQGEVTRRSELAAGVFDLGRGPNGSVWGLVHHEGLEVPARFDTRFQGPVTAQPPDTDPKWRPQRMTLNGDEAYSARQLRSWSLDGIFGIIGAGRGGVYGQVVAGMSDRLRNHRLIFSLFAYGDIMDTDALLFYTNTSKRVIWGAGVFQELSLRRDSSLEEEGVVFSSGERFFGTSSLVRYPFDRFRYVQAQFSIGGVQRTLLSSDRDLLRFLGGDPLIDLWNQRNEGLSARAELSLALGINTLRYHRATGPIDGSSTLLELRPAVDPFGGDRFARLRLDSERYLSLGGAANIFVRLGAGTVVSNDEGQAYFLSSPFTLRSVENNDSGFLLGRHFTYGTVELQIPVGRLGGRGGVDFEAVAAFDSGAVGDSAGDVWDHRVLNYVLGTNLGFGALELRWHYAKAIDIGTPRLPNEGDWKTNVSLAYRYR